MIKYFSRAFKITNENIILTTPLVLFILIFAVYAQITQRAPQNLPAFFLLLVTTVFMFAAFFAGWTFIVKRAIALDKQDFLVDEDRANASFTLIREFPVGVGEYFLSFVGALILYSALFIGLFVAGYFIGMHLIGSVGLTLADIKTAMESPVALKTMVSSLTMEQVKKLNAWNILFMSFMSFFSFITMFYGAQIVYKTKNPFIAFFKSLAFTFRKFVPAIILFVYINILSFVVSLIMNFLTVAIPQKLFLISFIVYLLSMLLYFYFVVYVVVLVFLYYDGETNPKVKIENRAEEKSESSECGCKSCQCDREPSEEPAKPEEDSDSSDSGSDSVGEDESGDSDSQGN